MSNTAPTIEEITMLDSHDWFFPVPIAYGPGRIAEIGRRCVELGIKKPFIVTDRGSRDLPFIERLQDLLAEAGLDFGVFADMLGNFL